jgi:hypothetical protein
MGRIITTYTSFEVAVDSASVLTGLVLAQICPYPGLIHGRAAQMGLQKLTVVQKTAVAGIYGLVDATAAGTPTAPGTHQANVVSRGNGGWDEGGKAGRIINAWSFSPTIGTEYLRKEELAAAIGAQFTWEWPEDDPLTVGLSAFDAALQRAHLPMFRSRRDGWRFPSHEHP